MKTEEGKSGEERVFRGGGEGPWLEPGELLRVGTSVDYGISIVNRGTKRLIPGGMWKWGKMTLHNEII